MSLDSQKLVVIIIVVKKQVLMLELCLLNNILHFQYYTTYCIIFFAWKIHHFTYLFILEGYIIRITNYYYDGYFSITAWGKPGE